MHNATADKWKLVAKRQLTTIGRSEGAVYTAVWAMVFLGPAMNLYVRMLNIDEGCFPFSELLHSWTYSTIFLMAFMVHDRLLAPLVIYKIGPKNIWAVRLRYWLSFLPYTYWRAPFFTTSTCLAETRCPRFLPTK